MTMSKGGPTPLQELFGEIAVALCAADRPRIQMRVWRTETDEWRASWGLGGSVGGKGATPEDAILQAHTNFKALRDRNRLQGAGTKRRRA